LGRAGEGPRWPVRGSGLRRTTHIILGMGSAGYVAALAGCRFGCWLAAVIAGIVVNVLIDVFGHEQRLWAPPRRTRLTHSIPGTVLVSLAVAAPFIAASLVGDPLGLALASVAAGLSHWLSDLITPAGVYLVRRRVRVPLARYDNPIVNALLSLVGAYLLFESVAALDIHLPL